jgi:hypothetical protein
VIEVTQRELQTPDLEMLAFFPRRGREEALRLIEEKRRRVVQNKIATYYPDTGPLRRELYPKHMAFFAAGASAARQATT